MQDFYVNKHHFCNYTAMRVSVEASRLLLSCLIFILNIVLIALIYLIEAAHRRQYVEDISADSVPGMIQREELGANC